MKKKNKKLKKKFQSDSILSNPNLEKNLTENEVLATDALVDDDSATRLSEKYLYVRKDIKRVLLYVGLSIILLVIFSILNAKTSTLSSFGDWIYKITNIQVG